VALANLGYTGAAPRPSLGRTPGQVNKNQFDVIVKFLSKKEQGRECSFFKNEGKEKSGLLFVLLMGQILV
jgi:hypothetical protein